MNKCIYCDSNKIDTITEEGPFKYKGKEFQITLESTRCNECGEQYMTAKQVSDADEVKKAIRLKVDGILAPEEIKHLRKSFGLTQQQASLIFGGGPRAFSKYEKGEIQMSVGINTLVVVANEIPGVLPFLRERAGISEIKGRSSSVFDIRDSKVQQKEREISHMSSKRFSWFNVEPANDGRKQVDLESGVMPS